MKKVSQFTNHIAVLIDCSGSMGSLKNKTVKVFDDLITDIKQNARDFNQETRISIYMFDDYVEVMAFDMDVERVPSLKDYVFTRGNTALAKACNVVIADLKRVPELYTDHAMLIYLITDGAENASIDTDKSRLTQFLKTELKARGNWTVAAHVPDNQGVRYLTDLGFDRENIQLWMTSTSGMEKAAASVQSSMKTYMQNRAVGVRSTSSFFQVDVSNLNAPTVQATLNAISPSKFRLVQNPNTKAIMIRELVEQSTGQPYKLGSSYYMLVKKEPVQASKAVLVREKGTGKVYGGSEARNLIGLPPYDVKVEPTLSPNYDIFVQSTSVNRNIIPKQQVLVLQ